MDRSAAIDVTKNDPHSPLTTMTTVTPLHFHGPFTFFGGDRSIARSGWAEREGIYLWTVTDGTHRFIH